MYVTSAITEQISQPKKPQKMLKPRLR